MKKALAVINPFTDKDILDSLQENIGCSIEYIPIRLIGGMRFPLLTHPDIVSAMSGKNFFHCPSLEPDILEKLESNGINTIKGKRRLEEKYPGDVSYNCLMVEGAFLMHKLDVTDETIKEHASRCKMSSLNVSQGYTRCSLLPVSDNAYITEDKGISLVLRGQGFSVCFIEKEHVALDGYPYGFIGGASAVFKDKIFFFGSMEGHPDGDKVRTFIEKNGKEAISLTDKKLKDLGGMFIFEVED